MTRQERPPILWLPALVLTLTPIVAVTLVPLWGVIHGYSWPVVLACVLFVFINGISITAGYHRLWAHNAYRAHPVLRTLLALGGAAATQNSILVWASGHRRHHRHVDDNERDPYSAGRGFWFSHMGWMLRDYESGKDDFSNAKDLMRDPIVMWQHRNYLLLAVIMNVLPAVLAGIVTGEMISSLLLVGVLRLVISHHVTFLINSLAHVWGKQPYSRDNSARDNGLLALLTYGEGYHNFHHMFQTDYRNGIRWWDFDPTKWLIWTASKIGLASHLKRAPDFKIRRAVVAMKFQDAQQKLASSNNTDLLREKLEQEYQQFLASLNEWNQLRLQWYEQKRERFNEATQELQQKWERTELHTRLRELEFSLQMQSKRLDTLFV